MDNSTKAIRSSNIELLRIFAIFGVISIHYYNYYAINTLGAGDINNYILNFFQCFSACSVNIFILISGYFMSKKSSVKSEKVFELLLQTIIFRELFYLYRAFFGSLTFTVRDFIIYLLPLNYYVVLYCCVYILSPYINKLTKSLPIKSFRQLVIIIFVLFSVLPTAIDIAQHLFSVELHGLSPIGHYGSGYGYTVINFIMMYIIGAYLAKAEFGTKRIPLCLGVSVCVLFLLTVVGIRGGYGYNFSLSYCNPFLITASVMIFLIFKSISIKPNKVINSAAKATFTAFLINTMFLERAKIDIFVQKNPLIMTLHLFACCIIIYAASYAVYLIYSSVMGLMLKLFYKKVKFPIIKCE